MPKTSSRFAALVAYDSDDNEPASQLPVITTPTKPRTEPAPVTPKQVSWGPSQKSAPVAPRKPTLVASAKPQVPRIGLKNGSWADECDSDDEE